MQYVLLSAPGRRAFKPGKTKENKREARMSESSWNRKHDVSQTEAYLYLFALRYMNYRVALANGM